MGSYARILARQAGNGVGEILMKKYTSPFLKSELRYFQKLMQNDTKAEGRGATYAKLEILLKED